MGTKFDFEVAVGFSAQAADATYPALLNDIGADWFGKKGNDEGLVLGDSQSGIRSSGLTLGVGRGRREKAFVAGSFTRPLADFLKAEVPTLSFAFPFCGNRFDTTGTPVDGDFIPLVGVDAILEGCGLVGAAWGSGTGHSYKFEGGSGVSVYPFGFAGLIYWFGNRIELLDCRTSSLVIDYTPGQIAIATATIEVGKINDPIAKGISVASPAIPVLDYGEQATISAPTIEGVAHAWNTTRGFSACQLTIAPAIETIPDSNVTVTGEVKEVNGRETKIDITLFADAASSGEVYELDQIFSTATGDLDNLGFTVGDPETGGGAPAVAHQIIAPNPEVVEVTPVPLGSKAANTVSMILGNATQNEELEIIFE